MLFSSEAHLTHVLARLFPQCVPPVLAIEPEQQWILLREVGPLLLRDRPTLERWSDALNTFAHLQIASLSFQQALLQAGCADRRLDFLVQDFDDLLQERVIWSRLQASQVEYLRQSLPVLARLCKRCIQIPLPATLVHGDLHIDNIVLHDDHPIFLDWSDACLAHPFFDAITFWARTGRLKQERNVRQALQEAYFIPWYTYASRSQLIEAVHLAEVLVCVHQLVSYRTLVELEDPWKQEMLDGVAYWVRRLFEQLESRSFL